MNSVPYALVLTTGYYAWKRCRQLKSKNLPFNFHEISKVGKFRDIVQSFFNLLEKMLSVFLTTSLKTSIYLQARILDSKPEFLFSQYL